MRERLTTGEVPFRKAYLGSLIDRVEVDDREVRIGAARTSWNRPSWRADRARPVFTVLYRSGSNLQPPA
jgi:hypothetical protein